jgi:hypothetical protein
MLEAIVPVTVAAITGISVLFTRTNNRILEHDKRMDGIELKVAERYITRMEVSETMKRFEEHFVRIESKLDNLFNQK